MNRAKTFLLITLLAVVAPLLVVKLTSLWHRSDVRSVSDGVAAVYQQELDNFRELCSQRLATERGACTATLSSYKNQFDILRRKCHEVSDLAADPDSLAGAINERLEQLRLRRGDNGESGNP